MKKTKIDYLTHTWNPLAMRCDPVSRGCENCWHLKMADRMINNPVISWEKQKAYSGHGSAILDPIELNKPFKQLKPARIGVQFMGDLFHKKIPYEMLEKIFQFMEENRQHKFLILTKRPERMREFVYMYLHKKNGESDFSYPWLDDNIWLGVSVEDQATADQRIPILLKTPASHRFISAEPLLGPVDFDVCWLSERGVDWVIAGGESGPNARACHPHWIAGIRNQCKEAGVPFFFKQWGEWILYGIFSEIIKSKCFGDDWFHRVGKKKAGHSIDGKEIRELPEGLK